MFTKFISSNIQEKLKSKERALGWKTLNSSQASKPEGSTVEVLRPKDIMSRTVYVRMCSNKAEVPNILISGGERDEKGQIKFGTDLYNSRGNQFRPVAGIKNISVEYKGGFKAIRECTVNWMVNSIEDIDELTPYFLTIGKTVVVDWGWTYANTKGFSSDAPPFITKNPANNQYEVHQSIFENPQKRILEMSGDYDAIGGQISNFEYSLRPDGGFDCITKITALGANLFETPLDKGSNQASTITIGKTSKNENDAKNENAAAKITVPPDNLINAVINLRKIIYYSVFFGNKGYVLDSTLKNIDLVKNDGWDVAVGIAAALANALTYDQAVDESTISQVQSIETLGYSRKAIEYYALFGKKGADVVKAAAGDGADIAQAFPNGGKGLEDFEDRKIFQGKYIEKSGWNAVIVDDKDNANIMLIARHGHDWDTFVTWAWFEDQLLNRYISFIGGEETTAKLTFRSIDTILHTPDTDINKIGEPISSDWLKEILKDAGDFEKKKEVAETYGIVLESDVDGEAYNDLVKTPTLIRNPPLLFPKNPNKFFTKENLPTELTTKVTSGGDSAIANAAKYELQIWKAISESEDIRSFSSDTEEGKDDTKPKGSLRDIWINVKEIQSAFGVDNPEAMIQDQGNVKPPGTLENGVKNLLSKLNDNFNNAWQFEIVTDPYDSTNIKIIDKKTSNINKPQYTEFADNSHKVNNAGIYKFPSFNVGSIVKSQNLQFKIPSSMAVTALYGSNKNKGGSNESDLNHSEINKMFLSDIGDSPESPDVYKDKYLSGLLKSKDAGDHNNDSGYYMPVRIGSQFTSHHSKILKEPIQSGKQGPFLVFLNQFTGWWKRWVPGNKSQEEKTTDSTNDLIKEKEPLEKLAVIYDADTKKDKIVKVQEDKAGSNVYNPMQDTQGKLLKVKYYDFNAESNQVTLVSDANFVLRSHINSSSPQKTFSTDDIIPAELALEIDGTGGIMPGDVIQTDYIQRKYNANVHKDNINFGPIVYFQIFTLNQKVDSAAWTTEINTKMRYNSIPDLENLKFERITAPPSKVLKKTEQPPVVIPDEPGEVGPDSAFSGFKLDNQFTLPPLETYKFKANPEDYIEPTPTPEELPVVPEKKETPVVEEVDDEEGFRNWHLGEDYGALPVDEPETVVPVDPEPVAPPQEIIKVVKGSPGLPRIALKAEVRTVEKPQVAVQEVTVVEYEQPEIAYEKIIPPPKPKPVKKSVPPSKPARIVQLNLLAETPIQKVKRQQKSKMPKRKANPIEFKSTYKADWADNTAIYKVIPLWRTERASSSAQRTAGDFKNTIFYDEGTPKSPIPKSVRQAFWDDNMESPNPKGISNRSIVSSNEASLLASGRYFSSTYISKYEQ